MKLKKHTKKEKTKNQYIIKNKTKTKLKLKFKLIIKFKIKPTGLINRLIKRLIKGLKVENLKLRLRLSRYYRYKRDIKERNEYLYRGNRCCETLT